MPINILVVDDALTMRKVIVKTIKISGDYAAKIFEAGNGIEALKVLNNNWVDLIITGLNMPEMDGMELIKNIKNNPDYSKLPIIVVTSRSRKDIKDDERWFEPEAHQPQAELKTKYLKKPFHPEQLRDIIFSVIGEEYARKRDEEESDGCDF